MSDHLALRIELRGGTVMDDTTKSSGAWIFFVLTIGWTWLFLLPAIPLSWRGNSGLVTLLRVLGGIGPAVGALILLYLRHDPQERRDYWQRVIDTRRIPPVWWAISLLTVPALTALAAGIDRVLERGGWQLEAAGRFLDRPLSILPFMFFILLFGPLPEELGWRGYALGELQKGWTAVYASLILGIAWVLWHLPLFFIRGTYQAELGLGTPAYWTFNVGLVTSSVLYTWIFNNTGGSTLTAILFHFSQNFSGELVDLTASADLIHFLLTVILAVLVVVIWGKESLTAEEGLEISPESGS